MATNTEIAKQIMLTIALSSEKEYNYEKAEEGLARATKEALLLVKAFIDKFHGFKNLVY